MTLTNALGLEYSTKHVFQVLYARHNTAAGVLLCISQRRIVSKLVPLIYFKVEYKYRKVSTSIPGPFEGEGGRGKALASAGESWIMIGLLILIIYANLRLIYPNLNLYAYS